MIRTLSLILEGSAEYTAKAIAAKQKIPRLSKVALDNRIALGYLLGEQEGVYSVANTTCCTWINTSGKGETQLQEITEQASWLKKEAPSLESFFDGFDHSWFGLWGLWLQSALQMLGIILRTVLLKVSLVHCVLSKALNACMQLLATDK